jgi:hypothetical protein
MQQNQTIEYKQSVKHKENVAEKETHNNLSLDQEELGLTELESNLHVTNNSQNFNHVNFEPKQIPSPPLPSSLNAITNTLNQQFEEEEANWFNENESDEDSSTNNPIPEINWHDYMEYDLDQIREDSVLDSLLDKVEEKEDVNTEEDGKKWAPFISKLVSNCRRSKNMKTQNLPIYLRTF